MFNFSIGTLDVNLRWIGGYELSEVERTLFRDIIAFFNGGGYCPIHQSYLFASKQGLLHFAFLLGMTEHRDYIWYSGKAFDDPSLSFWDDDDSNEYFFVNCNDDDDMGG